MGNKEQFHFEVTKEFKDKYRLLMIQNGIKSQKELFINIFEEEFQKNKIDELKQKLE